MKPFLLFSAILCLSLPAPLVGQESDGPYGKYSGQLFGALMKPLNCDCGVPLVQTGAGFEAALTRKLGASADVSYLFPTSAVGSGIGLFSPGLIYHFRSRRRTAPFVSGGYTLAFRDGAYHLIHLGGGLDRRLGDRWDLRFEIRDHFDPHSPQYHLLGFRLGILFH